MLELINTINIDLKIMKNHRRISSQMASKSSKIAQLRHFIPWEQTPFSSPIFPFKASKKRVRQVCERDCTKEQRERAEDLCQKCGRVKMRRGRTNSSSCNVFLFLFSPIFTLSLFLHPF